MSSATHHSTVAEFSFTSISSDVDEHAGPAVKVVELSGCSLTFAINVTVETVGGGSATGMEGIAIVACLYIIYSQLTEQLQSLNV